MANAAGTEKGRASPFPWTEELTYLAVQVFAVKKPYQFKPASPASINAWKDVLEDLSKANQVFVVHKVSVKQIRDHLNQILRKRQVHVNKLDKQSGINPETTPFQDLMDQVNDERAEHISLLATQKEEKKQSEDEQEKKARDMRLRAMETMGETQKRKSEDGQSGSSSRKERKTGTELVAFMRQRTADRREERQEEMAMRERELDARTRQAEGTNNAMQEMMRVMQAEMQNAAEERRQRQEADRVRNEQQTALLGAVIQALNKK